MVNIPKDRFAGKSISLNRIKLDRDGYCCCFFAGALNARLFAKLCHDIVADHETLLFHTNVRCFSKGNMQENL